MYKWALRVTRLTALALIALPEPITTVIGAGMLVGTSFITRKHNEQTLKRFAAWLNELSQIRLEQEASNRGERRDKVKRPIEAPMKQYVFDTGFEVRSSQKVVHHKANLLQLSRGCPVTGYSQRVNQHEVTHNSVSIPLHSITSDAFRPLQKIEHHAINMERLSARYGKERSPSPNLDRTTPHATQQATLHHMVNMEMLLRRYKTET